MSDLARSVWVVTLNSHPIRAFTVKRDCVRYLAVHWPKVPTNLRVFKLRNARPMELGGPEDVTARLWGLEDEQ